MLSSRHIFRDENATAVSSMKISSGRRRKGGLKDSINSVNRQSQTSSGAIERIKQMEVKEKDAVKSERKQKAPVKIQSVTAADKENIKDFSEIEYMHIYEESEDEYEDILPKSERFQQSHIDVFFKMPSLGKKKVDLDIEPVMSDNDFFTPDRDDSLLMELSEVSLDDCLL